MFCKSYLNGKTYYLNKSNILYAVIENGKNHVFFDKPVDGMTDAYFDYLSNVQLEILLLKKKVE